MVSPSGAISGDSQWRTLGRQVGAVLGEMLAAMVVALVVVVVGLGAFSVVHWPAFNSSNVTRAVTTVGQVGTAALLVIAVWLQRRHSRRWLVKLLSWVGISGFVTVTLGMPLAATKLYLFGISVDQEFRTEYLTRLTDSPALRDMTYPDLPPYYPAGWFWVGGRAAHLVGMPGWEFFKPYAIGTLALAAVVGLVLWSWLVRADWAIGVSAAVTAVTVAFVSPEAYGAVIAVLLPPILVLAWGGLCRGGPEESPAGGWGAILGTGLFLGMAASFYTLYFAFAAFAVGLLTVLAVVLRWRESRSSGRQWRQTLAPVGRLLVVGLIAAVVALSVWLPFLVRVLGGAPLASGGAFHYLPQAGAELPFPMAQFSLLGAFCLLGTVWLVVRAGSSRRARALGVGVVAIYLWSLVSMVLSAAGTTLLSFRLEPILVVLLAAAGAFGFVEAARAMYQAFNEPPRVQWVAVLVALLGALMFAQDIPNVLTNEITTAYTDTDGNGQRADRRDPGAQRHYRRIDQTLQTQTARPRTDTVVLTADTSFLAYYPYFGFQALTSQYANPLADFPARDRTINQWAKLENSQQFLHALDTSRWRRPDAFLMRRSGEDYTLRLARDAYPNDPNVRRYTVKFPAKLFADPRFTKTDIGPFTLFVLDAPRHG